jgi:hypothetical protein
MSGWLLKLATGNPLTLLWIAGTIALAAGGAGTTAGWTLNGWRLNSQIADVKVELANATARVAVLEPANAKCVADVDEIFKAWAEYDAAEAKRASRVAAAVAKAQLVAAANLETARLIMAAPRPAAGEECPAIIKEEADYVRSRQTR